MLTADRVREIVHYEPDSGHFYWLIDSRNTTSGELAGSRRKDGRLQIGLDGGLYLASRVAWLYMTGSWPDADIDHRDRDKSNDKFCNLRAATRLQNMANRSKWTGTSKYLGVCRKRKRWQAAISSGGVTKIIRGFKTEEDAALAYNFLATEMHGEFAVLNGSA